MDRKKRFPLRGIIFMVLLAVVCTAVLSIYKVGTSSNHSRVAGLKSIKNNELDAIFIGGSDIHAFWQPIAAWNAHGITSWNFSTDMFRIAAFKNYVIEARKSQPNALFVLSLSTMKRNASSFESTKAERPDFEASSFHRIIDYFPLSSNKLDLINRLCDDSNLGFFDRLEYYLPGIRFHSRLMPSKLEFQRPSTEYMSSLNLKSFFNKSFDVTASYGSTDIRTELDEMQQNRLSELLDYLDEEKVNVLFIAVPQALNDKERISHLAALNTLKDKVIERGYPCLDLMAAADELGLQPDTDYYDVSHTNIHGSLKVTEYISQYLIENYGFADKHGTSCAARWDKAAEAYGKLANAASLPLEREYAPRDYSLAAPYVYGYLDGDVDLKFMWEPVSGAEGYEIYRKSKVEQSGVWHLIAEAAAEPNAYLSSGLEPETEYTFTVVPYRTEAGERVYGSFDFAGFSITTAGEEEQGEEE